VFDEWEPVGDGDVFVSDVYRLVAVDKYPDWAVGGVFLYEPGGGGGDSYGALGGWHWLPFEVAK
jgi:hypothetical protein